MTDIESIVTSIEEDSTSKVNFHLQELSNWLTLKSCLFILVYGILYLVYEIALDLAHIRWTFLGFIICCFVDIAAYWIFRFALSYRSTGEKSCFLYFSSAILTATSIFTLVSSVFVLTTYRFTPEISLNTNKVIVDDISEREKDNDQFYYTLENNVIPEPEPCKTEGSAQPWQCGYIRSIKIAMWCTCIPLISKGFMIYLIVRSLRK